MVDTTDLKSVGSNPVRVRVPPRALHMIKFPNQLLWFLVPRSLRIFSLLCGILLTLYFLWFVITEIAGKPGDNVSVLIIAALAIITVTLLCAVVLHSLILYFLVHGSYLGWAAAVSSAVLGLTWGFFALPCVILLVFNKEAYMPIILLVWPITSLLRVAELYGLYKCRPK